ncbi:ATPase inhibitor, mitochondrial [Colletotrichum chlorophyti]|uniref:ATPase inhibitor, mitochondrial n=1 Tax=Colletotrichum chlorophyti TaxID=708187 RepID=A0A1Q8RWC8_9PEZI|nr:ATPase inhibitor, mitochondrial [Colletotrichum chlorophyti]
MMRIAITKAGARPFTLASSKAAFSTSTRVMAEGDTGAPSKYGGGDAFQKREKAAEDYAIRQREKEKLLELKKKLAEQQAHLQQLSDHIDEITKEQGGEHN